MNRAEIPVLTAPDLPEGPARGHVRIAAVQTDPRIGDTARNLERAVETAALAAARGASLVVYPECALTGYCFESLEEAVEAAVERDGAVMHRLSAACRDLGIQMVVGYLERTGSGVANAATLVGPEGILGHYRKTHLPHLGADRFTEAGTEPFRIFEAAGIRVGLLVCYDASFPEATRLLTLAGADLVVLPTNWPQEAEAKAAWLPNARAYENVIYFASVNRVGEERGFVFHGMSRVCGPEGGTLVEGPRDAEAVLIADLDPARARTKRIERRPGYWLDRIAQRREDLYRLEAGPGPDGERR